jgi:hypothetical protein
MRWAKLRLRDSILSFATWCRSRIR